MTRRAMVPSSLSSFSSFMPSPAPCTSALHVFTLYLYNIIFPIIGPVPFDTCAPVCVCAIAATGSNIYRQARTHLTESRSSPETQHGALLALGELLSNSGDFMVLKFSEACDLVLKYKDSRNKLVRRTVIALLPRLAHFQPESFISSYLDKVLSHLIASLKASTERPTAFMALGSVAVAVGDHKCGEALFSQLDEIIALLKDGLTPKRSRPFCPGTRAAVAHFRYAGDAAVVAGCLSAGAPKVEGMGR